MMSAQEQIVKKSQNKKSEIYEILEKLRQRHSQLFERVVDAIHNQDNYASRLLAREVAQIRKTISIIENVGADILTCHTQFPELMLCPSCCSPEISISQDNISTKNHCLECGKIWITGMDRNNQKRIEKTWSLA